MKVHFNSSEDSSDELAPLLVNEQAQAPKSFIPSHAPPSSRRNPQTSWVGATMLIVGAMAGTGVLAVPAATYHSGWAGLGLLAVTCVICIITANLLGSIMFRMDQSAIRDYASLGGAAFGKWGARAAIFAQYSTCVGVSIIFLLLIGILLNGIFTTIPARFLSLMVGIALYIFVIIVLSVKEVAWVSYLAVIATFIGTVFTLVLALQFYLGDTYPCGTGVTNHAYNAVPAGLTHGIESSIATGFAVYSFSFGGHALFPNFYMEMKKKERWVGASIVAYASTFMFLYFPIALVGYLVYGSGLAGSSTVLDAVTRYSSSRQTHIYVSIISGIFILHLLSALPIVCVPICLKIERLVLKKKDRKRRSLKLLLSRAAIVTVLTLTALVFPYFLEMISIVTALTVTFSVFIFPCVFYWKLRTDMSKGKLKTILQRIGLVLIIVFGIGGSVSSLVNAIPSLINAVKCNGNPFHNIFCFGKVCHFGDLDPTCGCFNQIATCGVNATIASLPPSVCYVAKSLMDLM